MRRKSPSRVGSHWEEESPLKRFRLFCEFCAFLRLNPAPPFFGPFVVFRPDASVALFWADEVGGALTRRRYPFRLSPRIQISPTFNCIPPTCDINDDWTDDPRCGILRDAWLAMKPNRIERT